MTAKPRLKIAYLKEKSRLKIAYTWRHTRSHYSISFQPRHVISRDVISLDYLRVALIIIQETLHKIGTAGVCNCSRCRRTFFHHETLVAGKHCVWNSLCWERIFIELMSSNSKLETSRQGSKWRTHETSKTCDDTRCKSYQRRINYRTEALPTWCGGSGFHRDVFGSNTDAFSAWKTVSCHLKGVPDIVGST